MIKKTKKQTFQNFPLTYLLNFTTKNVEPLIIDSGIINFLIFVTVPKDFCVPDNKYLDSYVVSIVFTFFSGGKRRCVMKIEFNEMKIFPLGCARLFCMCRIPLAQLV